MDWLVELSEKSPESLIAVTILLVVVVVGIFGMIGLTIIKGRNRSDPTSGLLEIVKQQLEQNGEQLTEMKALRADEQTREDRAHTRHEAILAAFQGIVAGLATNTTEVRTLGQMIGTLDRTMTDQIDLAPILKQIQTSLNLLDERVAGFIETQRVIDARRNDEDARRNEQVETIQQELGRVKTDVTQITKIATQELPATPQPEQPKATEQPNISNAQESTDSPKKDDTS